jgi:two-component system OmpR family response regulator
VRLLLVEDDRELANSLKGLLEQEGFRVRLALDGRRGLDLALSEDFDLILLDYFLPGLDGREFLKRLREEGSKVPVIALTVVSDVKSKVDFFQMGADDYITKPFHFEELMARIVAVRRRYAGLESSEIRLGPLHINLQQKKVSVEGKDVSLTVGEFSLLEYLLLNRGRSVSREELLEKALGSYEAESNTVEVLIHRLRKKLGRDIIRTQKGLGYRIE